MLASIAVFAPGASAEEAPGVSMTEQGKALHATARSTRFVIALEHKTEFQISSLSQPPRVVVDLPDVRMQLPTLAGDRPIGLVRSFRGGVFAPGRARVIIDVTEPVIVQKAVMEPSGNGQTSRLLLDIVSVTSVLRTAAAQQPKPTLIDAPRSSLGVGLQPPMPRRAERPETRLARTHKPIIVLDPGHGGHDSGAQKHGTIEKDVVLAFALKLRKKLQESHRYKVLMTRSDDTFVPLEERREFAERHKAALFIAIHADYANTSARGATIYSLREAMANSLRRSARGEVKDDVLSGKELKSIKASTGDVGVIRSFLVDLAQREVEATQEQTNIFTRSVIEYMGKSTNLKDNPDRNANFVVLKTAKVPAVLIELAYVTNREDARNLKSDAWRDKVTQSIMTAIDNFFSNQVARLPM
ncbi:MAG: N-acetylmuramoyl-L-alanine amidase [Hyphomicrobiaceae bacterium]